MNVCTDKVSADDTHIYDATMLPVESDEEHWTWEHDVEIRMEWQIRKITRNDNESTIMWDGYPIGYLKYINKPEFTHRHRVLSADTIESEIWN